MLNQNTIKVFKSMAGVYQDHYPVSGTASAACILLLLQSLQSFLRGADLKMSACHQTHPSFVFLHSCFHSCTHSYTQLCVTFSGH